MKIAIYCRVSTRYQVDKDSLPFQEEELKKYSEYVLGSKNYVIFKDAGYSAKNTDRPAFKEMFERIEKKEFTHLLVWKIDRISRNLLDFCKMYDNLKRHNCTFISKNEQFDTSSAMGEAMLKIILVFAELERKITAERVTSIMINRAEKGLWNGANVPLGYKWDKDIGFPVISQEEAETIQLIYNLYEQEESANKVIDFLNKNNISTKRGGDWTTKTLCDIIRNPFYKGTYRYNYRESGRGKLKDEKEWIIKEDNHDAIITSEQWQLCNDIMDKNSEAHHSSNRRYNQVHIFRGLLKCNSCGANMYGAKDKARSDGFRPSRYRCANWHKGNCETKIVTDVTIGSFIINYLINFVKAVNNKVKLENMYDVNTLLLVGKDFNNVKLSEDSLFNMYVSLSIRNNVIPFRSKKDKNKKYDAEQIALNREINKYEKALKRLDDLYFFDDESLSEKDYIIKKSQFNERLKDAKERLKAITKTDESITISNFDFLEDASKFLMKYKVKDKIDFKNFYMTVDNKDIFDFVKSLVNEIHINESGKVESISFKNGLIHYFIYNN